MRARALHLLGSPVLRQASAAIPEVTDDILRLVEELFETMYAERGIGLAANQIGVAQRAAVVAASDLGSIILINPVITSREGSDKEEEGCLSIPDVFAEVERSLRVTIETTDLDGSRRSVTAEGLTARAVQHEIDHLNGVLFLDHLSPLKRKLLLAKWKRLRRGETGYLKEVASARIED